MEACPSGSLVRTPLPWCNVMANPSFGAIVSGDCVPQPKPAPDIFVEAARRLGVPASACVVLEDSLAGMRAGRAAGMRVIGVPEAVVPEMRSLADAIVGDLHEAHALLAEIHRAAGRVGSPNQGA